MRCNDSIEQKVVVTRAYLLRHAQRRAPGEHGEPSAHQMCHGSEHSGRGRGRRADDSFTVTYDLVLSARRTYSFVHETNYDCYSELDR